MNRRQRHAKFGKAWRLRPTHIHTTITKIMHVIVHGGIIHTGDWTALIRDGEVTYLPVPRKARP